MTVLPSSDGPRFDASDESFVAELANRIFREGPALAGAAATDGEDSSAVPGRAANAATDGAAAMAGSAYRVDPTLTSAIPTGVNAARGARRPGDRRVKPLKLHAAGRVAGSVDAGRVG